MESKTNSITFFLNGKRYDIEDPPPEMTVLQWLRSSGRVFYLK